MWMACWLSLMLILTVAGREAMRDLNVFQLMEVRSAVGLLMLCPLILAQGGFAVVKTARFPQHAARNLIHYSAQLGWFFALTLIPIGQVVAIEFTMPIWTADPGRGFSRRADDALEGLPRSDSGWSASSSSSAPPWARSIPVS